MTHADLPALTHCSPSASEGGLPVTPTPGSPLTLSEDGGESASHADDVGHARPGLWCKKRVADEIMSGGGPSTKRQCVDVGSTSGTSTPVRIGKTKRKGKGKDDVDRAVAVQEDADDGDDTDDADENGPVILGLKRSVFQTPLRNHKGSIVRR